MKPRITLAETALPDGSLLTLQEHDSRKSLVVHGQQICGPATRTAEEESARLACAPFRPVRQPKLWFAGLGLGHAIAAAGQELLQKRAVFHVAEPLLAIPEWHRKFLPESPLLQDPRVQLESDCSASALRRFDGELHAILLHLDASPLGIKNRPLAEDPHWLAAAYDALQQGGILVIAGSRTSKPLFRKLIRAGFHVVDHVVPSSALAKKPRLLPIWLARKETSRD